MTDEKYDFRGEKFTLLVTYLSNISVAAIKGVFGFLSLSLALIADAIHSLFDSVSNIVGLWAFKMMEKPVDIDHPYGHERYEAFAMVFISSFIFFACFEIAREAMLRLFEGFTPKVTFELVYLLAATILINFVTAVWEYRRGEMLGSSFLKADAKHSATDIFNTSLVTLSVILSLRGLYIFDVLFAFIITALLLNFGVGILREAGKELLDYSSLRPEHIQSIAKSVKGVGEVHKIRSQRIRGKYLVELHVLVSSNMSIEEAHNIAHQVENKIMQEIPNIKDVTIHIEPIKDNKAEDK